MIFNRNLHVAVLVAAMMALGARASLVTSNEVVDAVSAWASANSETFSSGKRAGTAVAAAPTYDDDGTTVLYWTVTMSNGGAVIASPDTDLDLVVAFLEKHDGAFPAGHPMPSILKTDMKKRLAALAQRNTLPAAGGRRRVGGAMTTQSATQSTALDAAVTAANRQWAKYGVGGGGMRLMGDTLDGGDKSPYVRRIVDGFEQGGRYTHWNQSMVGDGGNKKHVYDYYTPNHAVCGCVATAGAAILQFFNCTNDIGTVKGSPTYGPTQEDAGLYRNEYGPCNRTIAGAIDWSILPAVSYGGTNTTTDVLNDECRKLLGRVTYNVGVLLGMWWDQGGEGTESGSHPAFLVEVFKKFGFKTSRCVEFSADPKTDGTEFLKTIYAQVWCGAPVVLGISGSSGRHAVVGCGYAKDPDGDEFCRVFMGWSGKDDAWYKFPTIQGFNVVECATTMIGYQDDAVVPVYGETNIPGVDLTIPSYITNGVTVTVPVNENGFFGIRVPTSIGENPKIVYEPRNISRDITPFVPSTIDATDGHKMAEPIIDKDARAELDGAIPEEIPFSILNATVKSTIESGRAIAERDGKALLMVSGTPGTSRTKALMEYLYWLDDTTDFSNKYVLVFNNIKSSDMNRPDGNPSIGVFDPVDFKVTDRWQDDNERLSYNAFIDFDASSETNELVYTFSETNTVVLTNGVADVLTVGYDAYLRRHSGITLTVTGVDAEADPTAFEVATVVPTYGVYTDVWTNGETVVFSAPGAITNVEEGTIISCVGWTTNEPFAYNSMSRAWELQPYNAGNEVSLQLFADDDIKLTWIWDVTHYRVTAVKDESYNTSSALVSPAESWVKVGGRATIVAEPSTGTGRVLDAWVVETEDGLDYGAFYGDDAMIEENGTAISFSVYEPVHVTAIYEDGTEDEAPSDPTEYSFTLSASPAEMQDELPLPMGSTGTLAWGVNKTYDPYVSLSPGAASYTDATGGVWVCTGWILNGTMSTSYTDFTYYTLGSDYVCVWELQVPESSEGPDPGPISIKSLERAMDGSWTVTLEGAVKDCWYWLYATDDLADFAGDEATWTAAAGLATTIEANANPQQATADGDIVFHTTGSGPALFWRARATSKEDGN